MPYTILGKISIMWYKNQFITIHFSKDIFINNIFYFTFYWRKHE